jgi:hypothetical protein
VNAAHKSRHVGHSDVGCGFASPSAVAGGFIECIDWFGVRTNVCTLAFRFQSFCSKRGAMKKLATASGTSGTEETQSRDGEDKLNVSDR